MYPNITYYPNGNIFIKEYRNQKNNLRNKELTKNQERYNSDAYCKDYSNYLYVYDEEDFDVIVYNINGQIINMLMYHGLGGNIMNIHYGDNQLLHNEYQPAIIIHSKHYFRITYCRGGELSDDYGFANLIWHDGKIDHLNSAYVTKNKYRRIYFINGILNSIQMNHFHREVGIVRNVLNMSYDIKKCVYRYILNNGISGRVT